MILTYSVRLLCLSLASFFLVNLLAGLIVAALSNAATRYAHGLLPRDGARCLLALRFTPVILGVCVVGGICVPSYLWMEPEAINEPVGWVCIWAAAIAILTLFLSAVRAIRAAVRSRQFLRQCIASAQVIEAGNEQFPVYAIDSRYPLFAVAGILRPKLLVSICAMEAFPAEELASALRHEKAHAAAFDNLKRFLMLLSPDILSVGRTLQPLEQEWARLAERAADDMAAATSPHRSIALASALVRGARFSAPSNPTPELVTGLMANRQDLSVRVERLLSNSATSIADWNTSLWIVGAFILTGLAVTSMARPSTLSFAHELLERLIQ